MKQKLLQKDEIRWTRHGNMSENEFIAGIKKAEEGPFHSVQESITHFETWLKSRKKQ
jgi:hypothetical protein